MMGSTIFLGSEPCKTPIDFKGYLVFKKMTFNKVIFSALALAGIFAVPTLSEARSPVPQPKPQPTQKVQNVPGQFDYYALTLSWSPDYCATNGNTDPQQCSSGKKLGFVLHGLWPQYTRGYPANCTTEAFDPQILQQFPNLYPSPKLYSHEWEKHGTCSGLTQPKYHQLEKTLKDSVKIPDRYVHPSQPFRVTLTNFKQDFVQANPGFTDKSIAPTCSGSGRFLQETQICYAKDGKPTACSEDVLKRSQKSCGQPNFLVRSVR
jgi:ribonuclease T2